MTATLRYVIKPGTTREELDFRTTGAKYTLDGQEHDYSLHGEAAETGSGAVNTVWTAPSISIDAKNLLGSADVVLFEGQWSDYTKVLNSTNGTIMFSRTVDGKTEQVTVADGIVSSQQDMLVFADGSVRTDTARLALENQGLSASVADLMKAGAATASTTADDWNATITSSHPGALVPANPGGSIRVSASEAASFALPTVGVSQVLTGSDGVDQVYITPGAVVDARQLLGGEDQIFLTGKWEDYTKLLDSNQSTITFTRVVDGQTESVIVSDGDNPSTCDLLVFADGAVRTDTARLALTQNLAASVADLKAQGLTTSSTADDWTTATFTRWGIKAPVIDTVAGDDKVNAAEKHNGVLISGSAEANSKIELQWGDQHKSVLADDTGKWSVTFKSTEVPDDGSTELTVTATDSTGYISTPATDKVLVDTAAPDAALVQPIGNNGTINAQQKSDGIVIAGTAEPGSTVMVQLGDGSAPVPAKMDDKGNWTVPYSTAKIPDDGSQNVTISVTDPAGNVTSKVVPVLIDTMSVPPKIDALHPKDPTDIVNYAEKTAGVTVTGTAEAGSSVDVKWGSVTQMVKANEKGVWLTKFDAADIPLDGATRISATATDVAGNVSLKAIHDVAVDTVVPAPVIKSVGREDVRGYIDQPYLYNDQYVSFWEIQENFTVKGTAEAGDSLDVQWGGITHQILVQKDGSWATIFAPTEVPVDGTTTLSAKVTDKAGNSAAVTRELIVDTVGPKDATIDPVTGDNVINAKEKGEGLTVTGTAEANGRVAVLLSPVNPYNVLYKIAPVDGAGHWSVHFTSAEVPNNNFTVCACATDAAGNGQFSGAGYTEQKITYDTEVAAPVIKTVATDDMVNAAEKKDGVTVIGTAEAGSSVEVKWWSTDDTVIAKQTVIADKSGDWSTKFLATDIPADGKTHISAIATDAAGNVSARTDHTVTVDTLIAAPVIDKVAGDDVVTAAEQTAGVKVTGSAELGSKVDVVWGKFTHTVDVDANGAWSTMFAANEIPADGKTLLRAQVTDTAGNSAAVERDLLVDTVVPAGATVDHVTEDNVINVKEEANGLTATGTGEANGHVRVWLAHHFGIPFAGSKVVDVDSKGLWSVHFASNEIPNNTFGVWAVGSDEALNQSVGDVSMQNFTYNTGVAAPTINQVTTDDIVNTAEKTVGVNVTGTAEAGSKVDVVWGATEHIVKADSHGVWSSTFSSSEIPANGHTPISAATDVTGNLSMQVTRDVMVDAVVVAPVVDKVPGDTVTGTVEARSAVSVMGSAEHALTGGADVTGNVSSTQASPVSGELNPVLSSDVAGATHFDVRSDIVLKSSQAGHLADGTWTIKVVNDANDAGHIGYRGESLDNSQALTFSVAKGVITEVSGGHVTLGVDGKSIVLDPTFDLDLGNKYHIEASAGMFQAAGGVSAAFSGANFATVSPGVYSPTDVNLGGVLAQKFDASGALVDSQRWVDITGNGRLSEAQVSLNAGHGDYAFVVKDLCGDDPVLGTTQAGDGVTIDGDLNVLLTNFGKSDLLYIDQQDNSGFQNDLTASTFLDGDGHDTPLQYLGGAGGNSQDGLAQVNIQLESGLPVVDPVLAHVVSDIHSTTGVVISG